MSVYNLQSNFIEIARILIVTDGIKDHFQNRRVEIRKLRSRSALRLLMDIGIVENYWRGHIRWKQKDNSEALFDNGSVIVGILGKSDENWRVYVDTNFFFRGQFARRINKKFCSFCSIEISLNNGDTILRVWASFNTRFVASTNLRM